MSLARIAQEALALSASERRRLIAQLVAADIKKDHALDASLFTKIEVRLTENWVAIDESKKQFAGNLGSVE